MKTMFVLMSHTMTEQQMADAKDTFGIERFVTLPVDVWSQIPAETESVESSLFPLKRQLAAEAESGDLLLVQGDYGATFDMVQFAKEIGLTPVYATSRRKAREVVDGEKVITVREFRHIRFRKF